MARSIVDLELVTRREEYPGTWSFEFRPLGPLRFRAGEFAHLVAPGAGISRTTVRHMSVASSPLEPTILFSMHLGDSPYKQAFRDLAPGQKVSLFGITGRFTLRGLLPWTPLVFVAGGIGITPIRSLIRHLRLRGDTRPWTLIHVGRHHLYHEELAGLPQAQYRIDRTQVSAALEAVHQANPGAVWFLSGSRTFITDLSDQVRTLGVPARRIRTEDFDH